MGTFAISKTFIVEADDYDEAWKIAYDNEALISHADDSGVIDVEEVEE